MAAIVGPGGSSTATTFAVDGPGDQLWQGTTCGVTCHTNGQMHVCLIASLVKIITKLCTNSSQPGWFHVETCMFHVLIHITNYKINV